MISRRIFVIVFAIFTVTLNTACPRDIANSVAEQQQLEKEYNEKVEKLNIVDHELSKLGVNIGVSEKLVTWSTKSDTDRKVIREKLTQYLVIMGRVIELSNHKAVKEKVKEFQRVLHRDYQISARAYLDSLNQEEGKGKP